MSICFHYHFHPVGQGLFASGCIYEPNCSAPRYLWVFDCGSTTFRTFNYWKGQARSLKDFVGRKRQIDLLTISHFDQDHINGITELLKEFSVDVLLLPYVPLNQRIEIAFELGVQPDSAFFGFFLNPVQYLRQLPGSEINRFIIVQESRGESSPPAAFTRERDPVILERDWKTTIATLEPGSGSISGADLDGEVLDPSLPISVAGLWEFVPYNCPLPRPQSTTFTNNVNALRQRLLADNETDRLAALKELKAQYDLEFGTGSKARNNISLTLYGGPIYSSWKACRLLCKTCTRPHPSRYPCFWRVNWDAPSQSSKSSILYTGDSYLDDACKFDHLSAFLGSGRMSNLGIFQVNHHGALANWHHGLASKINPIYSIVSSQPSIHHPHASVVADFKPFGFTQVDKAKPAGFCGWMI